MTQPKAGRQTSPVADSAPRTAQEVVYSAAAVLRQYLESDSRFTPEMAIDRVRALINSRAGSSAFLAHALEPDQRDANAVVGLLATALDRRETTPENLVLQLIHIMEGPLAVSVCEGQDTESGNAPLD